MQVLDRTRFSDSIGTLLASIDQNTEHGRLVRIYPAKNAGEVLKLADGRLFIGRDTDCELQLDDDTVSRNHASVERFEQGYAVVDHGSTNGTYVNEERIESRFLAAGDRVRFGNQIFKFLSADQIEAQYHEAVYKIMTTDGLTQTYNKRYLLEILEREVMQAARTHRPLCVLMFDVDRFKSINDTYGHLLGDQVLSELCSRATTLLRAGEVLARYGGEEFALVLADTTREEAREVAERLRCSIAAEPVRTEGGAVPVTISIGLAELGGDKAFTAIELLEQADRRLYAAKQSGRNRVMG